MSFLHCGRFRLPLDQPLIMGIINVTPDSFSDGGVSASPRLAVDLAERLVADGAHILDVGGESTRPGAQPVGLQEELDRVLPVLEGLKGCTVPVSVDTYKPEVMRAAIAAGASMVNDVNALGAPGALEAVAASDAGTCLMHMQGTPQTMQENPRYEDVVAEVRDFLAGRVRAAERAGIGRERIVADPGFGFGKKTEHNLALLRHLDALQELGVPLLVGLSRKSVLGGIARRDVAEERVYASVAAALLAVAKGAAILRVHDVRATRDALAVWAAVRG
ncbi:MAG TPA: dihydropteroate synthase [Burkholderiales bacterium]|nr:dihydropteroate synthase [Burkholderiales bacterium]